MELFIFRPDEYAHHYNCSLVQVDSIPVEKRRNLFYGIIFIILFFIYEILYLPCILTIFYHLKNECYKMLLFIGIVDMLALCIIGLLTGILAIEGAVFCSHPTLIYVAGSAIKALYNSEIIMEVILSINRCLLIIAPEQSAFLFKGNRTWFWCGLTAAINVYWFLYIKSIGFNSQYFNWFTNPYQGYLPGSYFEKLYPPNVNDFLDNLRGYLVLFGLPIIYLIFIFAFLFLKLQYKGIGTTMTQTDRKMEIQTLLQVFIIAAVNSITPLLYKFINFAPWATNEIMIAAMFGWLHIHAAPPVVFLLFNKTIRSDFKRRLKWLQSIQFTCKITTSPMAPSSSTLSVPPLTTTRRVSPAPKCCTISRRSNIISDARIHPTT